MEKLVFKKIGGLKDKLLDPRSWQRLLSRSWFLKGLSLCMAVMLWYFVGGKDTVDKIVMVPIEIINLPRDLVISSQFKKEMEVTVSGPSSQIHRLSNQAVTRQIDLSTAGPGTMVIENSPDSIPVPRGIKVLRVQPASLILSLDKLVQKHFTVIPSVNGKVATGHVLKGLKMNPEVITITGPETLLNQVDQLHTADINVDGISESQQRQVPLNLNPALVDLIGNTLVTADIRIGQETVEKKIRNIEVLATVDGDRRTVAPSVVTITARIPKTMLTGNGNLKENFSVTATEVGGEGKMKVVVVPVDDAGGDLTVVAVEPEFVTLIPDKDDDKRQPTHLNQSESQRKMKKVTDNGNG
ncbi:hypothetical protein JWG42_07475 [Desulfoprunum benzoelyticum]|uniref:YbbR-like protein n=1 Tax=Desulfoprunum benzoelyticum TaxID=1506996 RepID=A0A840USQ1_9BACT|nr:CdaR family protein [Desulfoprunum benzoelyticum]MBB5348822.1 hypothetical protein [Desulfoprunum benzoelyticum]MBM9529984.1 hypothetical protein [Desulfoprunum benzoelyticum]